MNRGSSKSLLPLVEILISIGIFAIAVVLTLQLFLLARFLGEKTSDTARAIFEVQNVAETIKSLKTDAEMENYVSGDLNGGSLYYDYNWKIVKSESEANYKMVINMDKNTYNTGGLYKFKLNMYKIEAYPFIDEKKLETDENYIPLLVSIDASKFISK